MSQADKGGKVVIMDKQLYESKMKDYLKECTEDHIYFKCDELRVTDVSRYVEDKYDQLRVSINRFLIYDSNKGFPNLCYPLKFEPYVIPRIYGNIKVHKEDLPIRPIISSINCLGEPWMEWWLLRKLEIIAESLNSCKILNSLVLFDELNGIRLDSDHELVSWDYDSMYTNIPVSVVKQVIRENYNHVEKMYR